MTEPQIDSDLNAGGGTVWQWLGLCAAVLGTITMSGVVAGFASKSIEYGWSDFSLRDGVILALIVAITVGLGGLSWRLGRKLVGPDAHVPRRERRSRNILLFSCGLGMLIGIILAGSDMMSASDDPLSVLSDSPIPPALAIGMTMFLVLVMPLLSWQWQKSIDEHEREAYQVGAVAAAYMFLILAPAWWLLWRGGLVPEPDGIILYFTFNFTFLIVWFWKKYR
jgi:hypothetical protein